MLLLSSEGHARRGVATERDNQAGTAPTASNQPPALSDQGQHQNDRPLADQSDSRL